MEDKLSIDQANPFLDSTNVVQSISDIHYLHTIVEHKSEIGTIVSLPNDDTCLLSSICSTNDNNELETGNAVDIFYEDNGQAIKDNGNSRLYQSVLAKAKRGKVFKATVTASVRKGLLVSVEGLQCFMPEGQIGLEKNDDYQTYVGQTIEVKLISVKLKEEGNRFLLIASHKILEDEKNTIEAQVKLKDIKVGSIVQGVVKSFANYGVFVTIFPTVDGLIHITDLSWEKVLDPSTILSIGQKVTVVVLDVTPTTNGKTKIGLGLKQLSQRPWERFDKNTKEGDVVTGPICNILDYGVFLKLPSGVQGLVHRTELSWNSQVTPRDFALGQILSAKIINLDWENEKLQLSIKQLIADPWEYMEEKFAVGDVVETTIINFNKNRIFVTFTEGIEGIIHISELSWAGKIKNPKDCYALGDKLKAVIISIDKVERKIELSHKRILPNPWQRLFVGQNVNAIVTEMKKPGIQVELKNDNLPAFIPAEFVPIDLDIKEGCNLECQIQEIDESKRRIILVIV